MANLTLVKANITNFQGIESLTVNFNDVTNVNGANGTGKTTLDNAIKYVFTGKNAQDKSTFDIKNTKNKKLNRGDHIVEIDALLNGSPVTFKTTYREKWETKRGSELPEMTGNTVLYEINGIPKTQAEYFAYISDIMPEKIYKCITNPMYFPNMHWQDQRAILFDMAGGEVSNDLVFDNIITIENKGNFNALITWLNSGQTVNDFKKMIASKISKIQDEKAGIDPRIKENIRNRPEPVDLSEVNAEIELLEKQISEIDGKIHNSSSTASDETERVNKVKNEINTLKGKNGDIEFKHQSALNREKFTRDEVLQAGKNNVSSLNDKVSFKRREIESAENSLSGINAEKANLLNEWTKVNETQIVFDDSKFACPTCSRPFEASDVDHSKKQLTVKFNSNKEETLEKINVRGVFLMAEVERLEGVLSVLRAELNELMQDKTAAELKLQNQTDEYARTEILTVADRLAADVEYSANTDKINELSTQTTVKDNHVGIQHDYKADRLELVTALDEQKKLLGKNDEIKKIDHRIEELKADESRLASEIASLQRDEFAVQQFIVAKISTITEKINRLFTMIEFRLFETQQNGGVKEACELEMDGVRFTSLNTGSKLNAGLDIINTISNHYNFHAPIVIDNRESVTDIIPVSNQIINLFVDPKAKKLKIS